MVSPESFDRGRIIKTFISTSNLKSATVLLILSFLHHILHEMNLSVPIPTTVTKLNVFIFNQFIDIYNPFFGSETFLEEDSVCPSIILKRFHFKPCIPYYYNYQFPFIPLRRNRINVLRDPFMKISFDSFQKNFLERVILYTTLIHQYPYHVLSYILLK